MRDEGEKEIGGKEIANVERMGNVGTRKVTQVLLS